MFSAERELWSSPSILERRSQVGPSNVAAQLQKSSLVTLPVRSGLLRATADRLEGLRRSDGFDLVVDPKGDVTALVLQDPPGRNAQTPPLDRVLEAARNALSDAAPMQQVVWAIQSELERAGGAELGLALARVSQADSRVEVLNAGMPPIACASADGVRVHVALSPALGRDRGHGHAYEVVPLIWNSTWVLCSSGLTGGSLLPETLHELCSHLDLGSRGADLASCTPEELRHVLLTRHPEAGRFARGDSTIVLVCADPNARLHSRISPAPS